MEIAKVTSKGQVTLPVRLRKRLQVQAGDRVSFEYRGEEAVLRVHREEDAIEQALEKVRGLGTPGIGKGRRAIQRWVREMRGNL